MKRRQFISNMAGGAMALGAAPAAWAVGEKQNGELYPADKDCELRVMKLAGQPLAEHKKFHEDDLRNGYLPYWDGTIRIDKKRGGFMPYLKEDGTHVDTIKRMYYQGRGIWVFSYIYNHFGKEKRFLDHAKKSIDFAFKHCRDENGYWLSEVTETGKYLRPSENIYGDMYIAMGMSEYYEATGDEAMKEAAIETCHKVTERIVSAEYMHLGGHGAGNEPGTKRLGTWQHFLGALTPIARQTDDFGVKKMASMCVRNILERHFQPDLGIVFERLDDQFKPYRNDPFDGNRAVSGWHSMQAAWMVMDDALRTGNKRHFTQAMEIGRLTLEKCWYEDENEAGISSLSRPERKPNPPSKGGFLPWHALDDIMIFCLLAIENTMSPWAMEWYDKVFKLAYSKPERMMREGLLHHPRRLFYAPQIIGHIIDRGGRVSGYFDGTV